MILAGESSEIQSLKTKINQLESQIEYNLQGLFERFLFKNSFYFKQDQVFIY